jgi:hypothetical protein
MRDVRFLDNWHFEEDPQNEAEAVHGGAGRTPGEFRASGSWRQAHDRMKSRIDLIGRQPILIDRSWCAAEP